MPLQRWTRLIAAAGLSLAVLGGLAPARATEKPTAVDPRVERIVKAALQNIVAAKGLAFEVEVINEVPLETGQRVQHIGILKTYVRRPNRLAASYQGSDRTNAMYYDGKVFTLSNPLDKVYATWEAPSTIDALFDTMKERIGFVPPLSALLREDAGSGARKGEISSAVYVGRAMVRGVDCHHLAFTTKKVDFQMWIADGVPVIRRVVVTYKNLPGAPQYTASFLDWDFNAQLSDYLFSFDPPPEATRIEFKVADKP